MIKIKSSGSFKNLENFLNHVNRVNIQNILKKYGSIGVSALIEATPKDSGLTALSWDYEIKLTRRGYSITWTNSNLKDGVSIALLLQYGHGTKNGTYVQGIDFINPTMKPIFNEMGQAIWNEVNNL